MMEDNDPVPSKEKSGENNDSLSTGPASPLPRPIFYLTLAFVLGIGLGTPAFHRCPDAVPLVAVAILLIVHFSLAFAANDRLRRFILPLTLFLSLGLLAARSSAPCLPSHPRLEPFLGESPTLFIARVIHPPDFTPDKVRLPLLLERAIRGKEEISIGVNVLASLRREHFRPGRLAAGDWLAVRLRLKRFHNFTNPGGFDYVRHQAEQGFYARAFISDGHMIVKLAAPPPFQSKYTLNAFMKPLDRFRQKTLQWVTSHLPPDATAFYAALILGYQRLVSQEWFDHLARTGTTHLLSIGGLHLGLVSLFVFRAVSSLVRFFCPSILQAGSDRQIALWPALLAGTAYAGIAGFTSPPIWRSMLMLTVCLIAAYRYRNPDPLSVLALSALAILVINPNAFWQISFQLTFVCMFAIFTLYPSLERFRLNRLHPAFAYERWPGRLVRPFEEAFWLSVAVSILVLPLTVYYFYGISAAGFVANIILVPFVGFVVLPSSLASVALFAIQEQIGTAVLHLAGWSIHITQRMIIWFSDFSWSFFWVGKPSRFSLLVCYATVAALFWIRTLKTRILATAALLLLMGASTLADSAMRNPQIARELRVNVVDVGQGASTLVRFPCGETMLVDGGGFPGDSLDTGRAVVAPFLWYSGIRRLDHVVLSHDHPDHSRGLRFILSHFHVGCFWETGIRGEPDGCMPLAEIAGKRGIPVRKIMETPSGLSVGTCAVRFLHPSRDYVREKWDGRDLNDISAVVQIDYQNTHCIIPGDISRTQEMLIFRDHIIQGPVFLIAAHHGSGRSTSPFLLDHLKPAAVAFSCGFENPFRFPAETVLAECRTRRIPTFRTDYDGAIQAVSDGTQWRVSPVMLNQ